MYKKNFNYFLVLLILVLSLSIACGNNSSTTTDTGETITITDPKDDEAIVIIDNAKEVDFSNQVSSMLDMGTTANLMLSYYKTLNLSGESISITFDARKNGNQTIDGSKVILEYTDANSKKFVANNGQVITVPSPYSGDGSSCKGEAIKCVVTNGSETHTISFKYNFKDKI